MHLGTCAKIDYQPLAPTGAPHFEFIIIVNTKKTWYILKGSDGHCDIVPMLPDSTDRSSDKQEYIASWEPNASPQEAIGKRVGLIRSGIVNLSDYICLWENGVAYFRDDAL